MSDRDCNNLTWLLTDSGLGTHSWTRSHRPGRRTYWITWNNGKRESKWLPEWWEATKLRHRNEATKCFCDCFRKCTVHGCCFGFWNLIHGRCFLTFSILACIWLFGIIPCLGLQNSAFCWSIPSSYLLKVTISIYIPPQILKWLTWNPDRYIMKLLIIMYGSPLEHHVLGLLLSSMNC